MAFTINKIPVLMILLSILFGCGCCYEFQVGGPQGWIVPAANDTNFYNHWASLNRFRVGDSIRFKYKKDSVMEVKEEGYKNCNASHPNMFSNDGNTLFNLDDSGSFYFISGASGHCQKGQKMILRVLTLQEDQDDPAHHHHANSATSLILPLALSHFLLLPIIASYVV